MPKSTWVISVCLMVVAFGCMCGAFGKLKCKDDEWEGCSANLYCNDSIKDYAHTLPSYHCYLGCFCKDSKVRNWQGRCVYERECELNTKKCPSEDEYFSECEAHMFCQDWCEDMKQECPRHLCSSGCRCREGFVRNNKDGKCIRKHQCPKDDDDKKSKHLDKGEDSKCLENEFFSPCQGKIECHATCSNMGVMCPDCEPGCMCKAGYVRRFKGGLCIKVIDCIKEGRLPPMRNRFPSYNDLFGKAAGAGAIKSDGMDDPKKSPESSKT